MADLYDTWPKYPPIMVSLSDTDRFMMCGKQQLILAAAFCTGIWCDLLTLKWCTQLAWPEVFTLWDHEHLR